LFGCRVNWNRTAPSFVWLKSRRTEPGPAERWLGCANQQRGRRPPPSARRRPPRLPAGTGRSAASRQRISLRAVAARRRERGSRKTTCARQREGLRAAAGRRPGARGSRGRWRRWPSEREVYLRGEESGEESGLGTEPLRPLNFLERDGSGSGENILLLEPLRSSFFLTKQHQNWDGMVPFYFAP
jgi:hypothetical protein